MKIEVLEIDPYKIIDIFVLNKDTVNIVMSDRARALCKFSNCTEEFIEHLKYHYEGLDIFYIICEVHSNDYFIVRSFENPVVVDAVGLEEYKLQNAELFV